MIIWKRTEKYTVLTDSTVISIAKKHIGDFIIIGDRYLDIETACKHNLKSIGCTYGYCEPHELDKADITVSEISEIPKAVEKLL